MSEPHWERGYRFHGYWIGYERIGGVTLPPGRDGLKHYGYGWFVERPWQEGKTKTLKAAKLAVEKAVAKARGQ